MSDRDISAISSYEHGRTFDPPDTGHRRVPTIKVYVCSQCGPVGGSVMPKALAVAHAKATGHIVTFVAEIAR